MRRVESAERDELLGVCEGHGSKQDVVEQCEHRGDGADAECERYDRDNGERGGTTHLPKRVAQVGDGRAEPIALTHGGLSLSRGGMK